MQKSTQNQKLKNVAYNFGRLANFIKVKVNLLKNNLLKWEK
jgi:hypothetical protein|tara:strand:+ start:42 stop:164 length:123 start_codon:yes stop_codon:yes gene_type:complete